MKKAMFIADSYRGDQQSNLKAISILLRPVVRAAGLELVEPPTVPASSADELYPQTLMGQGSSCLMGADLSGTLIIGFEMSPLDLQFLAKQSTPWINLEIHPLRFLNDLYFAITTSLDLSLNTDEVTTDCIESYADVFSLHGRGFAKSTNIEIIEDHAAVILGQAPRDKSVFYDAEFKSLMSYEEALKESISGFRNIYYKPHPLESDPYIKNWLEQDLRAETLDKPSIYDIFASGKITLAVGISSSALTEAPFFGVESRFLEPRAQGRFGPPISLSRLVAALGSYLKVDPKFLPSLPSNHIKMRDLFNYWSFPSLRGDLSKMEEEVGKEMSALRQQLDETTGALRQQLDETTGALRQQLDEATRCAAEAKIAAATVQNDVQKALLEKELEVRSLRESWSWRITAPLRYSLTIIHRIHSALISTLKAASNVLRRKWQKRDIELQHKLKRQKDSGGNNWHAPNLKAFSSSEISPRDLLTHLRLDVICKYRLFREMINGDVWPETERIYRKHVFARTGGLEPFIDDISYVEKSTIDQYITTAADLLKSMQQNGFQQEFAIPVFSDKRLRNGAHRLAAALALDIPVFANRVSGPPTQCWDFQWFLDNGFKQSELLSLLYEYTLLKAEEVCVYVFYAPSEPHWGDFKQTISETHHIVGAVDISMPDAPAQYELINDLYQNLSSFDSHDAINRKAKILSTTSLKIHVVLAEKRENVGGNPFELATAVKDKCRDIANASVAKETYLSIHASSTVSESIHMARVLFSPNNLAQIVRRKKLPIRREFFEWLSYCKETCVHQNINPEDICIVGSSPLEILGVRDSTDIDFTLLNSYREQRYGDGITHLNANNDIVTKGYHRSNSGRTFSDDELVSNPELHFIFRGFKFANPEIVLERKDFSRRDKDLMDLHLWDAHQNSEKTRFTAEPDFITAYNAELTLRQNT